MRNPLRLESWLTYDAIDRAERMKKLNQPHYDRFIAEADFGVNVVILVILLGIIVWAW